MIDAHQVQNGGVQVVDMHLVPNDVPAILIGCAVNHAAFDAAAGHPIVKPKG